MDFLNSPDLYWDVGGSANSLIRNSHGEWIAGGPFRPQTTFQRCLLHRLGDRFGIRREPQEDGFIRIFKTPASNLPDQLLLNVSEKELQIPDNNNNINISSTTTTKPRKMKIMKRSSSSNISTGSSNSKSKNKNANGNKTSTQTDKERQYAEARARIFQQSQEEAMAETFDPIDSSSSSLVSPLTPTAPEFIPAGGTGDPTKPNKATWRNRQSELNDPDFQRRRTPAYYGFVNPSIIGSTPPLPPSSSAVATAAASLTLGAHPSIAAAASSHLNSCPTTTYYPSSVTTASPSGYPYSTTTTGTSTTTMTTGYFTARPPSSTSTTTTSSSTNIPTINFKDFPSLR